MKSNELKGLPVINASEGTRLGDVSRAYLDPKTRKIIGFAISGTGGLLEAEWAPKVDMSQVLAVGPDAVVLSNADAVQADTTEKRFSELIEFDELAHRGLLTTDGRVLGKVSAVEFDRRSFEVTGLEIAHGRFSQKESIPISTVLAFGRDFVIVESVAEQPADISEEHPSGSEDGLPPEETQAAASET